MSFGIRSMKKIKEEQKKEVSTLLKKHIVVGQSYEAIYAVLKLSKKYGKENVLLLTELPLNVSMIKEQIKCTIPSVRDEKSAEYLRSHYPALEILPSNSKVQFYKDGKFYFFGSKAKPMPLLAGEKYFTQEHFQVKLEKLFENEWENVESLLENQQMIKFIETIQLLEEKNEPVRFEIIGSDDENIHCEQLYWVESPQMFVNKVKNKNQLSDEFMTYVGAQETMGALTLHFECHGQAHDAIGTFLLPQSMTHEWGHFICQIDHYEPETDTQSLTVMMMIREGDDVSEEDLAKKVRLMKRVMQRSLSSFKDRKYKEYIYFKEQALFLNFEDDLSDTIWKKQPYVHMLGSAGPVTKDFGFQHFARSMSTFSRL